MAVSGKELCDHPTTFEDAIQFERDLLHKYQLSIITKTELRRGLSITERLTRFNLEQVVEKLRPFFQP